MVNLLCFLLGICVMGFASNALVRQRDVEAESTQTAKPLPIMTQTLLSGSITIVIVALLFLFGVYAGNWTPSLVDKALVLALAGYALFVFLVFVCRSLYAAMPHTGSALPVIAFLKVLLLSAVLMIVSFALCYHVFGVNVPRNASAAAQAVDMLYFSSVTFSTLGYGDFSPDQPVTKLLAALQAISGNLHLAALVGAVFAAIKT